MKTLEELEKLEQIARREIEGRELGFATFGVIDVEPDVVLKMIAVCRAAQADIARDFTPAGIIPTTDALRTALAALDATVSETKPFQEENTNDAVY